jgi:hypothetical protein
LPEHLRNKMRRKHETKRQKKLTSSCGRKHCPRALRLQREIAVGKWLECKRNAAGDSINHDHEITIGHRLSARAK